MPNRHKPGLGRRELIRHAGGLAGASLLPGLISGARAATATRKDWDLIVIGGGTAGLPTALFAAQRARVLVIEKGETLGGTLDRSTGQVAAAGTVFQEAKGIKDTPEAHYDDILRISENTVDPALTRLFVNNAAASLNWLAGHGYKALDDHPVTGHGHEHFRTARYLWGERGGWSIYEAMQAPIDAALASGKLAIEYKTSAVELLQSSSGRVTGVRCENSDGVRSEFSAKQLVIASGGCASNASLFEALHSVPLYCQFAHPNSQGQGILLGLGAGGFVRGGEKYTPLAGAVMAEPRFPAPPLAFSSLNPTLRQPWEILVNVRGERFVREDYPGINHIEHAIAKQPGHQHWAIFDERILKEAPPLLMDWDAGKLRENANEHPMFARADTLSELAVRAGINPNGLQTSVKAYNAARSGKQTDPMGLEHRPLPIAEAPYYAVRMRGWTIISFAGLGVDQQLRVIRPSGEPIPGLYAVGEVIGAGATSGAAYTNGMLVTPALTFGRLLGKEILDFS